VARSSPPCRSPRSRAQNPYIIEEWASAGATERSAEIRSGFRLLVAGPEGDVYHVTVDEKGPRIAAVSEDELRVETDIWQSLRNGTVVGRVLYREDIVPLVNVTSALLD
jgi:hypothetical protein